MTDVAKKFVIVYMFILVVLCHTVGNWPLIANIWTLK